jgi:hypothetical protein
MSFLRNPSFENDKDFWRPVNFAGSVTFSVGTSSNPLPVTGTKIASIVSLVPGGSLAQDVAQSDINAPSLSCFAWVTSVTGNANGFLTIWNLGPPSRGVAAPFTVQNPGTWQLVMNTLDLGGAPGKDGVRVEIYSTTPGGQLSIDCVNLF